MKNWNFYQITTIDNALSIIVKSPMNIEDLSGYFAMKLRNSTYLTISQFDVKHIENAIIDREAINIIHDTWVIKTEKKRCYKDFKSEQFVLSEDILKCLNVKDNHIEVISCYNNPGGASQEFRLFKTIIDMCDFLGITLDYDGPRNNVWLRDGDNKVTVTKHSYGIEFSWLKDEEETYIEVVEF